MAGGFGRGVEPAAIELAPEETSASALFFSVLHLAGSSSALGGRHGNRGGRIAPGEGRIGSEWVPAYPTGMWTPCLASLAA